MPVNLLEPIRLVPVMQTMAQWAKVSVPITLLKVVHVLNHVHAHLFDELRKNFQNPRNIPMPMIVPFRKIGVDVKPSGPLFLDLDLFLGPNKKCLLKCNELFSFFFFVLRAIKAKYS